LTKELSFLPHLRYLKNKCTKALNLLRVVAHNSWGADQRTLLHLYRSFIRSKVHVDYGCVVYYGLHVVLTDVGPYTESCTPFMSWCLPNLSILQPLCTCKRTTSLCTKEKLFIQYRLKLSSSPQNPIRITQSLVVR